MPPATAATSTSGPAATTSTTRPRKLQQARVRAAAATRSAATTASTRSSAPAISASPRIPSDLCVALAALAAIVHVHGGKSGESHDRVRRLSPAARRSRRGSITTLQARRDRDGASSCPPNPYAAHSAYLKTRDRQSYAFALVSVAAALDLDGDTIRSARLALGGVAHKPWRDESAEAMLVGEAGDRRNRSGRSRKSRRRAGEGVRAQRVQDRAGRSGRSSARWNWLWTR